MDKLVLEIIENYVSKLNLDLHKYKDFKNYIYECFEEELGVNLNMYKVDKLIKTAYKTWREYVK